MDYLTTINNELKPSSEGVPLVLDLFAGCGGLALGFEAQGFDTLGFEADEDCCNTYRNNLHGDCIQTYLTPDYEFPAAEVVIGGPPCQPFSVGGNQLGLKDSRDGFPVFISAIRQLKPKIWMFENVRGLLYRNKWYLEQILQALDELGYSITFGLLNAVNYGVPQNRERVIVVGHHGGYEFPEPLKKKTTAGEAVSDMAASVPPGSKFLTPSMDKYIARYEKASCCKMPRDLHLNKPARTLTCRNLAGATGDMHRVKLPDGRRRRIIVREAARLQSFPDWFSFSGNETSQFYQIGNAVPPLFAYHIAQSVREYLSAGKQPESGIERPKRVAQIQAHLGLDG